MKRRTVKTIDKELLLNAPDYVAGLLGLEPGSDEAARRIQLMIEEMEGGGRGSETG
jgi:hypothetical protein